MSDVDHAAHSRLEQVVREEWGRLIAQLLAQFRRLDLVEDALGDAVEAASRTWTIHRYPDNPAGWLMTAARRRIVDRLRTEGVARRTRPLLIADASLKESGSGRSMADPGALVEDDLLRLVLMCAHPALAPEAASALSPRLVLGVPTPEVARLFLVSETAMAARLTRAKKRIVSAAIPFVVPGAGVLPERFDTVAQTAYLAFTAGYAPGSGPDLLRAELSGEAVRLVRVSLGLCPDEPVLVALLALVLLQHSRRDARTTDGRLVLLPDQDRSQWHHAEIEEARALLEHPRLRGPMTPRAATYTVQARIAAEHALSPAPSQTRWDHIVSLYDLLIEINPNPGARLARAVAVAEASGPAAGLAALEGVDMVASHRPAAVRAELLARSGDVSAARDAYDQSMAACSNEVEKDFLRSRHDELA